MKPFHVFTMDGCSYLVKLVSNRICTLSKEEAATLLPLENKSEVSFPAETEALLSKYNLLSEKTAEFFAQKNVLVWERFFQRDRKPYALELMVSQECNFECAYCYGSGNFGGSGFMSWETAKRAIDWFFAATAKKQYPSGSKLQISFFGGEPLLNFPVIRQSVAYVTDTLNRQDTVFSITTNLYLLTDEMLDFFLKHKFNISVSFDGKKQKENRRLKGGGDSYSRVASNVCRLLQAKPEVPCRATMYGDGTMAQMQEDIRSHGFQFGYVSAASGKLLGGTALMDKSGMYDEQAKNYRKLAFEYLSAIKGRDEDGWRKIAFDLEFMRAVGLGWEQPVHMMSCGCGRTLHTVDTNGTVYPCHRFVGVSRMALGTIHNPYEELDVTAFSSHICMENPKCKKCFLRFRCGGGCLYENYCDASVLYGEASVYVPFDSFCECQREMAELAIHLTVSLNSEDKEWLRKLGGQLNLQ